MKKAILAFVALTALLALVLFFSLNSIIENGVESFGTKTLGAEVALESASVSFLSGEGRLDGLSVANPDGYPEGKALLARSIRVAIDLASLFSDVIVIHEINVEDPVVNFATGAQGSNINALLRNARDSAKASDKKVEQAPSEEKKPKRVVVDEVRIEGGQVSLRLTDVGAETPRVSFDPIVMRNVGQGGDAVTAAEVFYEVFEKLAGTIFKAALSVGGQAEQLLRQGLDAVRGLFE
ncbi:MAG: hypothetical protein ACOCVM_01205 [Desulfovibrionaceae bacterium]